MGEPQNVIADRIVRELLGADRASSVSNITFSAGGVGLWVAVTCCVVMLAANVFLAVIVMDHSRKIDDLGDYLSAIYMQAPHLKPAEGAK